MKAKRSGKRVKETFGDRVKQGRQRLEMTQHELAVAAGMSISYVSMIERGEREVSLETLRRLADALQVRPGDLMDDREDELAPVGPYKPVLDYVRERRLTSRQVEQLLRVARAMFS